MRINFSSARGPKKAAEKLQNGRAALVHNAVSAHEPPDASDGAEAHHSTDGGLQCQIHGSSVETEQCSTVTLLDLPPALLHEICAHIGPGASRTGVVLPFVCRAFRTALSDVAHQRLWSRLEPELCRGRIGGIRWPGFRAWLAPRAAAVRHLVLP